MLIKVIIEELEFHLFTVRIKNQIYWGVDALQPMIYKPFQQIAFSICSTYGFLKGDLNLNDTYYCSSEFGGFETNVKVRYVETRESLLTSYGMITTNPYSIYVPYFKEQDLPLDDDFIKSWNTKLLPFPDRQFSALAKQLINQMPFPARRSLSWKRIPKHWN